jgi:hypothetical protein
MTPEGKRQVDLGSAARWWPTPDASVAQDGETASTWLERRRKLKEKGYNGNGCGTPLTMAVQLWPTPKATPEKHGRPRENDRGDLQAAARFWPTPSAQGSAGETSEDLARKGAKLVNAKTGRVLQTNLATEVKMWRKMWPTPMAWDHWMSNNPRTDGGQSQLPNAAAEFQQEMAKADQPDMWQTPLADDARGTGGARSRQDGHQAMLHLQAKMWPTPRVGEGIRSAGAARTEYYRLWNQVDLSSPTEPSSPSSLQGQGKSKHGEKSSKLSRLLNPLFVTWLMNWPLGWADVSAPVGSTSFDCWAMASSLRVQLLLSLYFSQGWSMGQEAKKPSKAKREEPAAGW